MHARDRFVRRRRPGRHFHEQGVVRPRDDGAGVRRPCIESDAEAGGAAIGRDASVVGNEIVLGVFRRDAALHGITVQPDVRLRGHAAVRIADTRALGDAYLRPNDVDSRYSLGHRVLHLHAWIHLDEVELAGVRILQKLDRARVEIAHCPTDLQRLLTQRTTLLVGEKRRRRTLDDLLVAPLYRAITLEQMHEIAVRIPEQLHFDVTRTPHEFLEIHLVIAERRLGLAARGRDHFLQVAFVLDDSHAAAAAAPTRLEHHRKPDCARQSLDLGFVVRQWRRSRHHRNTRGNRQVARHYFVAETAHDVGCRTDEDDAGLVATLGEFGVLGQEAVPRMYGVDMRGLGDTHDVGDIEVRLDGPLARSNEIALVGLHPMQRKPIFLRINRDRPYAEFRRRPHDTDGDLTAIRNEETLDSICHGRPSAASRDQPPAHNLARSSRNCEWRSRS